MWLADHNIPSQHFVNESKISLKVFCGKQFAENGKHGHDQVNRKFLQKTALLTPPLNKTIHAVLQNTTFINNEQPKRFQCHLSANQKILRKLVIRIFNLISVLRK